MRLRNFAFSKINAVQSLVSRIGPYFLVLVLFSDNISDILNL
jgi:hypothetical protein